MILGLVYFPPNLNIEAPLAEISDIISVTNSAYKDIPIIIGGDFNCRVGELNNLLDLQYDNLSRLSLIRSSLDTFSNPRGQKLNDLMESNNFLLLNGRTPGDTPANYTYLSKNGASVIDLVWINITHTDLVYDYHVALRPTQSDHFPTVLTLNTPVQKIKEQSIVKPLLRKNSQEENYIKTLPALPPVHLLELKNITELAEYLSNSITESAEKLGMRPKALKTHVTEKNPWLTPNVVSLNVRCIVI